VDIFIFLLLQTPAPTFAAELHGFDGSGVWHSIRALIGEVFAALPYLGVAIVVFFVFRLIARFAHRAVKAFVFRVRPDDNLADLLAGLTSVVLTFIGVVAAVLVIFPGFNPRDVLAAVGAVTVALGFIFRDISENFISGIIIMWRRPYVIGDQINVMDFEGTVEGFTFRSTLIKTYLGELAIVPNSHIFAGEILVKTAFEKRGVKFNVGIGYLDDIETGRAAIRRVLFETEGVITDPEPWIYVSELAASSVNFTVYFFTESHQANVLRVSDKVATGIKHALDKVGIDAPYPHSVVIFQETGTPSGGRAEKAIAQATRGKKDQ
jgi:small conductance mechanosensitive channel